MLPNLIETIEDVLINRLRTRYPMQWAESQTNWRTLPIFEFFPTADIAENEVWRIIFEVETRLSLPLFEQTDFFKIRPINLDADPLLHVVIEIAMFIEESQRREELVDYRSALDKSSPSRVKIFYATDRTQQRGLETSIGYSGGRSFDGKLFYGSSEVTVPAKHRLGKLERPSIFKLEFRKNRNKHFTVADLISFDEEEFIKQISTKIAASPSKDAFVFIHGYNVTFNDAAMRTAQLAFDLNFSGAPILYSWPSNGNFIDYMKDEAMAVPTRSCTSPRSSGLATTA